MLSLTKWRGLVRGKAVVVASVIILSLCAQLAYSYDSQYNEELLTDTGFEQVQNGAFTQWFVASNGVLTPVSAPDVHGGATAARFVAAVNENGYCFFVSSSFFPVNAKTYPGPKRAVYHVSIYTKGTGTVSLAVGEYSASGVLINCNGLEGSTLNLTSNWQKIDVVYNPYNDPNIYQGRLFVLFYSSTQTAYFDDASVVFNTQKNAGIPSGLEKPAPAKQ